MTTSQTRRFEQTTDQIRAEITRLTSLVERGKASQATLDAYQAAAARRFSA